jgi:hypothetical protein
MVRAALHHVGGAGVPPEVRSAWTLHAREGFVIAHHRGDGLLFERAVRPDRGEPQRAFVFLVLAPREPHLAQVFGDAIGCLNAK